jgi:hypothetical protein
MSTRRAFFVSKQVLHLPDVLPRDGARDVVPADRDVGGRAAGDGERAAAEDDHLVPASR